MASPENEYFERNYNRVVYQETINDLDALSLILTPVGLDFLADGTAAIYATLYGEYGEAIAYGIALVPFVGEVGKRTVKAFVQGARKVRKTTRNYELMPRGYLFSGLGWDKILNSPAIKKLRGMKLSEPLERQLYEDLKRNPSLKNAINNEPDLLDDWLNDYNQAVKNAQIHTQKGGYVYDDLYIGEVGNTYPKTKPMLSKYKGEEFGQAKGISYKVSYMSTTELDECEVFVRNGKLFNPEGKLINTTGSEAIFVMDNQGTIFVKDLPDYSNHHHSSFFR